MNYTLTILRQRLSGKIHENEISWKSAMPPKVQMAMQQNLHFTVSCSTTING